MGGVRVRACVAREEEEVGESQGYKHGYESDNGNLAGCIHSHSNRNRVCSPHEVPAAPYILEYVYVAYIGVVECTP